MLQFFIATLAGTMLVGVFMNVYEWNFGRGCLFQILYMVFGITYFYIERQKEIDGQN